MSTLLSFFNCYFLWKKSISMKAFWNVFQYHCIVWVLWWWSSEYKSRCQRQFFATSALLCLLYALEGRASVPLLFWGCWNEPRELTDFNCIFPMNASLSAAQGLWLLLQQDLQGMWKGQSSHPQQKCHWCVDDLLPLEMESWAWCNGLRLQLYF